MENSTNASGTTNTDTSDTGPSGNANATSMPPTATLGSANARLSAAFDASTVRAGTGATAEELAVFETADAEAAAALVTKLEARNADRIENYSSYIPSEVPKLEDAVIISGGRYVVLCVAEDASGVREAAQKALG